jgi:hypothetical protein
VDLRRRGDALKRRIAAVLVLSLAPALVVRAVWADPPPASSAKGPTPKGSGSGSASASAPPPLAPAQALSADIMVLHASNQGGGIDPRIGNLPQLKKPPFSAYDTYKLLSQSKTPLPAGKPIETQLPNGRTLQVTLKDAPAPGRYKVAASINQPGGTTFLPLLEVTTSLDEPFFVAGQSHQGGVLVVGIKLVK